MSSSDYGLNLQDFANSMIKRIQQNMPEKDLSWRQMRDQKLILLLQKYVIHKDWVSVANVAFMLWENEAIIMSRDP